jgi:RHS repeat-associated protein
MNIIPSSIPLLIVAMFVICGLVRMAEQEYRDQDFSNLLRKYFGFRPLKKLFIALFLVVFCQRGGSKPTNSQSQAESGGVTNTVVIAGPGEDDHGPIGGGTQMSILEGEEPPRLTSNQYAAGFALLTTAFTNTSPWLAVPSNAVAHAPWTRYGLAEDTFWLPATNWTFVLSTNAVEGAHVSSSGTLSFNPATPKGSPRATAMPDGDTISFLAPLQGSLGTVPPQGRFWYAVTTNSSVLMTWQDLYAGRDSNSPVTFQAELFGNGDFTYRYAFTNGLSQSNFVVGAQHNGGGEAYTLNDTNMLVNGLELRWRAFGMLDPGVDDHDGDGLSTYDEVMRHNTDPTMPDTDLDGLGDAAEVATGLNPLVRYSNGYGMPDGSNPQALPWSNADFNTNGLPDAWENYWFGTNVTSGAYADDNGDGFINLANLLTGTDPAKAPPPGFAVTNTAPVTGIDAWEIAPAFALDIQTGMTNVLSRTIPVSRTSPWQQFFISSKPSAAGAWSLDGLELSWAGTNVSGSATVSPSGDSMRLALDTNLFGAMTFRIAVTRTTGLVRSPKPLYLVRWTPEPAFTPGGTVSTVTATNGIHYAAASLEAGGSAALPFTLDLASRPGRAQPGEDELAERSLPPDPGSAVYPVFTSPDAGFLTAPQPGEADLPASGTNMAVRVVLHRIQILGIGGVEAGRPFGRLSAAYPLDSASLRDSWRNNASAAGVLAPNGFEVSTGLDSGILSVTINGVPGNTFIWGDGALSAAARGMSAFLAESESGSNDTARAEAFLGGSSLWSENVEREPDDHSTEDDDSGDDDEKCECGDPEGGDFGSVKLRIPLGSDGRDRISGFLWMAVEESRPVSTDLFHLLADPLVSVQTNYGGIVTVTCTAANGRTLTIDGSVSNAVTVSVFDSLQQFDHSWEISNPLQDENRIRLTRKDRAGNPVSDETFTWNAQNAQWTRLDTLTGATEDLYYPGVFPGERRTLTDASGMKLSDTETACAVIGSGDSAVKRVTCSMRWDGLSQAFRSRHSAYWSDSLNALRNGRLKLRRGDDLPWEYRACDSRGRVTLSAGPLDGSPYHPDLLTRDDIATPETLAALQGLSCLAKAFSYATDAAAGDSASHNDSRQPRMTTSYEVRGGSAKVIAREWRVCTRDQANGYTTVAVRTVRAASASAEYGDPANAVSLSVSYAGSEELDVPPELWDLPLREEREDGAVQTWTYESGYYDKTSGQFTPLQGGDHLRVVSRTGTAALPEGIAGLSTYTADIRDAAFGRALARETRLNEGGANDPVLSWEKTAYDANSRLVAAAYSDGTSESNVWGCCRLQARIGRDGTRTDYSSVPGDSHWSATVESSLAALPGSGGLCPAVESYTDAMDRETNSVRRVYNGLNPAYNPSYPDQATRTEYPFGTDGCRVTTDPMGVRTLFTRTYGGNCVIEETVSAGVTNRATRTHGGATVTERLWTDPVSGETRSLRTRTETSWDAAGLETETVSISRDGGPWTAESSTAKDFLGRMVATAQAGHGGSMLVTSNAYDTAGRLVCTRNPDGSAAAYAYDALGNSEGTVLVGAGQALLFDPQSFALASVIATETYVAYETPAWKEYGDLGLASNGVQQAWWDCNATVMHNPGRDAVTTSIQRVQFTGLTPACVRRTATTDANGVTVITTKAVDSGSAKTTVISVNTATSATDISESVSGVQTFVTNILGSATFYTFDGFARQVSATENAGVRTLQRSTGYHDDGTVAYIAEICGVATHVTSYSERQYLQVPEGAYAVTAIDALNNETVSHYAPDGHAYWSAGATYPTATALDADGRQAELRTWRDETGQPDITRWFCDQESGLVTNKVYANGKGPAYTHTAAGRLASRTWARGITTAYSYADTADGRVQTVTYSDATPDITNRYDLTGRLVAVADGAGTRTLSYNAKGQLTSETNSLAAFARVYDSRGKDTAYDLSVPGFSTGVFSVRYGYDSAGRLNQVTSALNGISNTFTYSFIEGSALVAGMTGSSGIGWTRSYEPGRNLITAVSNFWGTSDVSAFAYANDAIGRRTLRVDTAPSLSATNAFAYNHRSEVTNAAMNAVNYSYSYDDIGNRQESSVDAVACSYTVNSLNQYTAIAGGLACSPEYDFDGNMTWDGKFIHVWDGENRLTCSEPGGSATNGSVMVENSYDYQNRRFKKVVKHLSGRGAGYPMDPSQPGTWNTIETRHYVWDSWNIAAEIVIDSLAGSTNIHYYTWGLDLSGSIQGAGGVGGLLADTKVSTTASDTYFPCFDANGNVTEYVNNTTVAHYEYSVFGEITAQSCAIENHFTHRFSTKPFDAETSVGKYQQRDYISPFGRWVSRDPVGEHGGKHLYGFVVNNGLNSVDFIGLVKVDLRPNPVSGCGYSLAEMGGNVGQTSAGGRAGGRQIGSSEVACYCDCEEKDGKVEWFVVCYVSAWFEIELSERWRTQKTMPIGGSITYDIRSDPNGTRARAYGHEQRHVLAAHKAINKELVPYFEKIERQPRLSSETACNIRKDRAKSRGSEILAKILGNSGHAENGGLEGAPSFVGYDPLGVMPGKATNE